MMAVKTIRGSMPNSIPQVLQLSVTEGWEILKNDPQAQLVDVRTEQEWRDIGQPDLSSLGKEAVFLSYRLSPNYSSNPQFIEQLQKSAADLDAPLLFMCKAGGRSQEAALLALSLGYTNVANLYDGFEGRGTASTVAGWLGSDLPRSNRP